MGDFVKKDQKWFKNRDWVITRSRDHEEENGVEDHGDKDVAKMHEEEAHMNVRTETL